MCLPKKLEYFYLVLVTLYHGQKGCHGYDPEASITGLYTGPYFDPLAPRNLTAHLDDRAVLPCTVRQLGDKSVSWVRMRDADILTVDRYTFVSDERFEAHYSPPQETWNLVIKYVQERDAGQYECQVSTEPKMSQLFNLRVVVPRVSMDPPGDRYVKAGSKVRIDCQITDVVQQPDYIFWYHDGIRVLENQDSNLDVNVKKTGEESLVSTLTISRVRRDESGNYTCMPSNLHGSSVLLHVLNEEHPEAMKDGRNASCKMEQPIYLFVLFVLCTALNKLFNGGSLPNEIVEKKEKSVAKEQSEMSSDIGVNKKISDIEKKKMIDGKLRLKMIAEIVKKINLHLEIKSTEIDNNGSRNEIGLMYSIKNCIDLPTDINTQNKNNEPNDRPNKLQKIEHNQNKKEIIKMIQRKINHENASIISKLPNQPSTKDNETRTQETDSGIPYVHISVDTAQSNSDQLYTINNTRKTEYNLHNRYPYLTEYR